MKHPVLHSVIEDKTGFCVETFRDWHDALTYCDMRNRLFPRHGLKPNYVVLSF